MASREISSSTGSRNSVASSTYKRNKTAATIATIANLRPMTRDVITTTTAQRRRTIAVIRDDPGFLVFALSAFFIADLLRIRFNTSFAVSDSLHVHIYIFNDEWKIGNTFIVIIFLIRASFGIASIRCDI